MRSNRAAGEAFLEAGASACTDVTGFGLLGHLGEMLDAAPAAAAAAGVGVELELGALPYMEGALECHHDLGITSSLYPSNLRQHQRRLTNPQVPGFERLMPLLFDPQTCGGLLAAVPAEKADALVQRLREHYPEAAVVGTVISGGNGGVTLV
uniref:PurM-like C-terminal domain-containing protein n=1 Tax=Heterosigma akashiwo TaxID=2829 RepID=A0A7S3Y643_HETAK